MKNKKLIIFTAIIVLVVIIGIILCINLPKKSNKVTGSLNFDNSKWNYDEDNNVYYQIGVTYCTKPEQADYETLGIYVPGEYLNGTKNSDGTYACTVNEKEEKAGFKSSTAPIILPVDTPGYSAQKAPTSYNYNSVKDYIEAGYVYVLAGMRGRSSLQGSSESLGFSGGAPYGVTDLKAAVRYYRYNENILPGNTDSIFSYGMSGGGAQSALIGATGDSELYFPYLESTGAAMTDSNGNKISDAIAGSMCWCPITNLDIADEGYEWNMGQFFSTGTRADGTFTSELSDDLAQAFVTYINAIGLKSEEGEVLKLEESADGIYLSGSYYDYILKEIETSLNNFLSDTTFPYTYTETKTQIGNTAESGESFGMQQSGDGNETRPMKSTRNMDENNIPDFANGTKDFKQGEFGGPNGNNIGTNNPMYYLSNYYGGNGTSTVAKYWRIRTGINQTDTALTTEENLKLALENNTNVESVDFATVWG